MVMKKNPRTGRKTHYLGHRVKDVGKAGLDSLSEVRGICRAIVEDYHEGKISYSTAVKRLVFLKTTVIRRSSAMKGKKREAYAIVNRYLQRIQR